MKRLPLIAITILFFTGTAVAQPVAGPSKGQWTGSLNIGTDLSIGGDFHSDATVDFTDLGVFDSGLVGSSGTLSLESRSFDDIYDVGFGLGLEVGYGLSNNAEVFGSIRYSNLEADPLSIGSIAIPSLNGDFLVNGTFDDFSSVTAELGYRHFFRAGQRFRPFIAGRAGMSFVESIDAEIAIPNAAVALDDIVFYGSTSTFNIGAGPGFVYQVTDQFGVGLEGVFRYSGELDGEDADLSALGLSNINDDGDRFSASGQLRLMYAF